MSNEITRRIKPNCNSNQVEVIREQVVPIYPGNSATPFLLSLDFNKVDLLKNLRGSIYIDPTCGGNYVLEVIGQVDGFANLSTFKTVSTNTLNLTASTVNLANGLKELSITGTVPLRVNDTLITAPGVPGYNFRTPTPSEIPLDSLAVVANTGSGSTAGDIFYTVDVSSIQSALVISKYSTLYNGILTPIEVLTGNTLRFVSSSDALSLTGNNGTDTITIGVKLDSVSLYNDLSVSTNGLLSYHIPYYIDTLANINITFLDTDSGAQALPLGALAIWKNNDILTGGITIRKQNTSGSNQWVIVGSTSGGTLTGVADTSTVNLDVTSNIVSATVPLRITTLGTTVSLPTGSASIGYQFQSQGNTVAFTNPTAGVINLEVDTVVSTSNSSTANVTNTANNVSVVVPLRINNAAVTVPTGSTPVGYNITSTGGTITPTNPSAGVINLEASFLSADTSTVDMTVLGNSVSAVVPLRLNGVTASVPGGSVAVGYNLTSTTLSITQPNAGEIAINSRNGYTSINTDTSQTGTTNIASTGNDFIFVLPAGNLSANRIRNLSNSGAVTGSTVTINTYSLTSILLNSFAYQVTADSGVLNATPLSLAINTFYEFAFNGTSWVRTK